MEDGDLRLRERPKVKAVFINIALGSGRGINQAIRIHEGKLVQMIEPLHACLIRLQMRLVGEILCRQQINGHADRLNLFPEVILHDLFPASRQLVEIQQAHRTDGFLRIASGTGAHPHRSGHQNDCEDQTADDRYCCGIILSSLLHQGFTPSSLASRHRIFKYSTKIYI